MAVAPSSQVDTYRRYLRLSAMCALVALALLGIISTILNQAPERTLMGVMSDHLRHEYAAWSALQIGADVYREPIQAWSVAAEHPHPRHGPHPHNYPPLSLVLFLPFGLFANLGIVADRMVHALMVVSFIIAGALVPVGAYRSWRGGRILGGVLVLVFAIQGLRWGAKGMFDVVVLLVVFGGLHAFERRNWSTAVLLLTVAIGLHYRVWWIAPLAVVSAWREYRENRMNWAILVGLGIASVSLASAGLLLRHGLSRRTAVSHWGWENAFALSAGDIDPIVYPALMIAAIGIAGLHVVGERPLTVLAIGMAAATVFTLPQWPGWYYLLLLPVILIVDTTPGRLITVGGLIAMEQVMPIYAGLPSYISQALSHIIT